MFENYLEKINCTRTLSNHDVDCRYHKNQSRIDMIIVDESIKKFAEEINRAIQKQPSRQQLFYK